MKIFVRIRNGKNGTVPLIPPNSGSLLDYGSMNEIEEQHIVEP